MISYKLAPLNHFISKLLFELWITDGSKQPVDPKRVVPNIFLLASKYTSLWSNPPTVRKAEKTIDF
jgi:hypothetical protein